MKADLLVTGRIATLAGAALEDPVEAGGPLEHLRPDLVLVDGEVAFEG